MPDPALRTWSKTSRRGIGRDEPAEVGVLRTVLREELHASRRWRSAG